MKWPWSFEYIVRQGAFSNYNYCASCEKFSPLGSNMCPNCGEYVTVCRAALMLRDKIHCWTGEITVMEVVGIREYTKNGLKNYAWESLVGFGRYL
jgi:predicted amidophosphoribosyltransferase